MRIILDASALIAVLLGEKGAEAVEAALDAALVSTVNVAEVVSALARDGNPEEDLRTIVAGLKLAAIPPDEAASVDAGLLRRITDAAGLSLGDRFCLALARRLKAPVLTADRAWTRISEEAGVEVRMIR